MQAEMTYAGSTANGVTKKIIPIVPYSVKGKYRNTKSIILVVAYAMFFLLPWLQWNGDSRQGQALLFDLANSRFYFFGLVIFPQDLMILMAIMVAAATFLFMSATFYGRIFCGFFCFQTLWTDVFRIIEKAIQGEAQAQIRLRKAPWSLGKVYKITVTHVLWLLLAFATALTFAFYFAEAHTLLAQVFDGTASITAYTTIITITCTTYVAAGFAREDICRVACPYGKFQTVMQDPATKTVVYDADRGERALGRVAPAIAQANARQEKGYGDCVDCGYCVNVCPTGVDIRKGFQIDCISCGLCIDACDTIMRSIKLPTGLIRFDAIQNLERSVTDHSTSGSTLKRNCYLLLLVVSLVFIVHGLTHLEPFSAVIQQQAQPLVTRLSNGDLKSRYILRLTNKSADTQTYQLVADGLPAIARFTGSKLQVPSGKTYIHVFDLVLPAAATARFDHFTVTVIQDKAPEHSKSYQLGYLSKL
jgi:cytochrome c oxidase accessory protein FixG